MRHYFKIIASITFIFVFNLNLWANKHSDPDFAYPKQVSQQAEANLEKAIKNGDGNMVVKSLIEYAVAQDKINNDSIQSTIVKIEQIIDKEKNPCTKALLNSLLLEIYCNIYQSDENAIELREKIGIDYPSDLNEWSKDDFSKKIKSLVSEILADSTTLKNTPLKNFGDIISHDDLTYIFYPTLYDFAIYHIIENIHSNSFLESFPATPRIVNIDTFLSSNGNNDNEFVTLINSLYHNILSFHINDTAALINWEISRIEFEYDINQFSNNILPAELEKQYIHALNHLYTKYEECEYATNALLIIFDELYPLTNNEEKIYTATEMYQLLNARLKKFPTYYNNCFINQCIDELAQQTIHATFPAFITPNDTLSIAIENNNTKHYVVEIHRLPNDIIDIFHLGYDFDSDKDFESEITHRFEMNLAKAIPFSQTDTIKTSLSQPGYYTIVTYSDSTKKEFDDNLIRCTSLQIALPGNLEKSKHIWVLNPKTGEPVTGAKISIFDDKTKKIIANITSRKDGKTGLNLNPGQYIIKAYTDVDKFSGGCYHNVFSNQNNNIELAQASIFTSLPIYHPGDSIEWSAVIYNQYEKEAQLCKNRPFTIMLRDANYMQIDTIIATTDRFGRIEGKFLIPTDRLTGYYTINILGNFNRVVGSGTFMVSDYKLPTFNVTISNIENNQNGTYSISGEVKTLSGFALSDATATISFSDIFPPISVNYSDTVATNSEGKYSFIIPTAIFEKKFATTHFLKAIVTATSATGESQKATRNFSIGNQFYISNNVNTKIEASKKVSINAVVLNLNGDIVDTNIHYSLINNKLDTVMQGSFSTSSPIVDWSNLPSGKYNLKLYSVAPTATDTTSSTIFLYRLSDDTPPCNSGLWIQNNEYSITNGNSIDIYYGSTFDNADILYILHNNDSIYEQRWIKAKKGIHKTRVFLPLNVNNAKLLLCTVNNYTLYKRITSIKRDNADKFIKITAECFRDKIIPGRDEQWRFHVSDNSGNGSEAAMIFDMYSLAIEKIKKHNFNLNLPSFNYITDIYFTPSIYQNILLTHLESPLKTYSCPQIIQPELYTFNHRLGYFRKRNNIIAFEAIVVRGISSNKSFQAVEQSTKDASYPEKKKLSFAVQSTLPTKDEPNISLRDNETPLAFFCPMLTTDTLGNLTYSFTVPNANTTWIFNAIAFNNNMEVASFSRNILANKPLMVQPNMPRFLRNGDNATIKASVMNNSDSSLVVTTIIELFDPSTGKTTSTHRQTDTIQASQSALASIKVNAPVDASMIGYRIKSYCDNFGDGEQSLIPILPASSPVIESSTFYMGVDQKSFTQQLPSIPADARVTLEFCENPAWYAVTALPGLNKNKSRTSTSAAMTIYSAAVADGLVRQNPQIANALYQWQHSDKSDSTLVSMLSRNQDLKNMLLCATPWVQDASNDTQRMAQLSLLFDKKEIKNTIDKNIHILSTLQRHGGGWAWIAENNEASAWGTLTILEKIGHLKKLGFLPQNKVLNTMIENAIKYIDAEYTSRYKEYPNGDYRQYVLIRDMFPEYKQASASKKITNATIQKIIANWKRYSIDQKAISAIILNNNGYNSTAREILNSVNEFSQTSQAKGMWWPSIVNSNAWDIDKIKIHANILDAYHQISPSNKDIDLMRQWLIINKEANDWGNSFATSYVIYTLLNTGSRWTTNSMKCEISLDNTTITPSHFDNITGYLRSDISQLSPSGKKLSIIKHSQYPSWGAVYQQYCASMNDIKAVASNDISIEKTILKKEGDTWIATNECNVGDIIRIQLTIKTKRDIDYVSISDERAACFEPTEQLPRPLYSEGIYFYRENRDDATNIFVTNLPKGTYLLTYDMYVNNEGSFASGIATIQSQYAPQITAHSSGNLISVK